MSTNNNDKMQVMPSDLESFRTQLQYFREQFAKSEELQKLLIIERDDAKKTAENFAAQFKDKQAECQRLKDRMEMDQRERYNYEGQIEILTTLVEKCINEQRR